MSNLTLICIKTKPRVVMMMITRGYDVGWKDYSLGITLFTFFVLLSVSAAERVLE